jgi:hypothetical protein
MSPTETAQFTLYTIHTQMRRFSEIHKFKMDFRPPGHPKPEIDPVSIYLIYASIFSSIHRNTSN